LPAQEWRQEIVAEFEANSDKRSFAALHVAATRAGRRRRDAGDRVSAERDQEFMATKVSNPVESDFSQELREWIEAFDDVVVGEGPEQGAELLTALKQRAREAGIAQSSELTTPYVNTIPKHEKCHTWRSRAGAADRGADPLERDGDGAPAEQEGSRHRRTHRDVFIAGHTAGVGSTISSTRSMGISRAILFISRDTRARGSMRGRSAGRLDEQRVLNFRHELRETPGLSSYPHPC